MVFTSKESKAVWMSPTWAQAFKTATMESESGVTLDKSILLYVSIASYAYYLGPCGRKYWRKPKKEKGVTDFLEASALIRGLKARQVILRDSSCSAFEKRLLAFSASWVYLSEVDFSLSLVPWVGYCCAKADHDSKDDGVQVAVEVHLEVLE